MFANNAKCSRFIHNVTDCPLLQDDIHHAIQWSFSCDLDFNTTMQVYSRDTGITPLTLHIMLVIKVRIMTASQCKDLGIIFTPTLS